MRAEAELVAELQSLSKDIYSDLQSGAGLTRWRLHRRQIAELRERVRSMRDRHLYGVWPAGIRR